MALEALSSNDFLNFMIYYDVPMCASSILQNCGVQTAMDSTCSSFLLESHLSPENAAGTGGPTVNCMNTAASGEFGSHVPEKSPDGQNLHGREAAGGKQRKQNLGVQGPSKQKRRRRPRISKNKEEAETQRMTHIVVERNRRKQMNEHLAVLRSLMPESYVQRGDQASIVGGAIEYVKELEHLLQCLEAQKLVLLQQQQQKGATTNAPTNETTPTAAATGINTSKPPFAEFFTKPQYAWSQAPNKKYTTSMAKATGVAEIEVTLIETHANIRILSRRRPRQIQKLVIGLQTFQIGILHLTVTTLDLLVLYNISAKIEEDSQLTSVDDIAQAVHHMLGIIEEEAVTAVR